MIEYKVLDAESASTLTIKINQDARDGWMVSEFAVSSTYGDYMSKNLFACVMERERKA